MKKRISFLVFTTMTIICLIGISCEKDDGDNGSFHQSGKTIQINGKTYKVTTSITMEGYWDEDDEEGTFTVTVVEKVGSSNDLIYYEFYYLDERQPKVGDDFAKKSLYLENPDKLEELTCEGGSATVVSINKEKGIMTIHFENLRMTGCENSYTFNGTVPVDFNFGRTSYWD